MVILGGSLRSMMAQDLPTLILDIDGKTWQATLASNTSAQALAKKLKEKPLEIKLKDYGNFEKVGSLPFNLERNDEEITTEPGDIILYQGNKITIYYDKNTWKFTKLAKIKGMTREKMLEVLGDGEVTVKFSIKGSL